MNRVPAFLLLFGLLAVTCPSGEPAPDGSQNSAATAPVVRPVLKREDATLTITFGEDSLTVEDIYIPDFPSGEWKPDDLVSPDGKRMVVPLADSTYAYFELDEDGIERQGTIEGGVAWSHSYYRSRRHWHFTSWEDANTRTLMGDKLSQDDFLHVEVKFEEDYLSFCTKSEGDDERSLSLRLVFPDGSGEIPFRYSAPKKTAD